jgi:hypothetical protein
LSKYPYLQSIWSYTLKIEKTPPKNS